MARSRLIHELFTDIDQPPGLRWQKVQPGANQWPAQSIVKVNDVGGPSTVLIFQ
jgi:hypothetical protein